MHHFDYRDDDLFCEGVSLDQIAKEVGTPTYVYSRATFERHYRAFDSAFEGRKHLVCYSVKANSNLAILHCLFSWGAGADIVSIGELERTLRAGCDPKKIVFSGVGKRGVEIAGAIEAGILAFNVESAEELSEIDRVASSLGKKAPVSLRVNPDVDAETHPYISTGLKKNKFGISVDDARAAYQRARTMPGIEIVGIDCHIGSQLTKTSPFRDAVERVATLAQDLVNDGVALKYLDVGGGLGIPYEESDEPPSPEDYAKAIESAIEPFAALDLTLLFEPGRVIAGNAGVLLTQVLYRKVGDTKNFVIVDAAFNDLLRPAFYGGHHGVKQIKKTDAETWICDVVGPICETGDFLARDRQMKKPEPGALLAFMSAGAYGFVMASNYNTRPRAAEVLVSGDKFAVVRERETIGDLMRGENIPDWAGDK